MTGMSVRPLGLSLNRAARWIRVVVVSLTILVLMGLSFVLGRTTIGHTDGSKIVTPVPAVQPVAPQPLGQTGFICHLNGPC